jgi:hypothetical protein
MPGGIQPGTTATSTESKKSEKRHIKLIAEEVNSMGPDWGLKKSLTIEEIVGKEAEYSKTKKGISQRWDSDGGFIFYQEKLVGVCENKYQANRENACERVCKYLTFLNGSQMFVSFEGPGFEKIYGGGSTGPLIDTLRHAGATVLENVSDEAEYRRHIRRWLESLKSR